VGSHAVVEVARVASSRLPPSLTFTQTDGQTNPALSQTNPALPLVWPAVLGGSWQAAAEINLPYANCAGRSQLGTGVHLVSVCWHALRAPDASWVSSGGLQTGGLSKSGRQVVVRRPGCPAYLF
jgi:hypothetical protein